MPTISETSPITLATWNERVQPRIEVAANGCWNWTHSKLPAGYGMVRINGPKFYTHRLAYEVWIEPIPEGLFIDHLCRNTSCCNPEHLEPVTHRVNTIRGEGFSGERFRQTHCIHGHEFDAINTYIAPNGTRKCRTCRARVRAEYNERLKHAA